MELSSKYRVLTNGDLTQKEPGKQNEAKTSKGRLIIIGGALIFITAVAILAASVAGIDIRLTRSQSIPPMASGLTVTVSTQRELEGEYYGLDGGIRFKSHTNGSFFHLAITTMSGDPVIIVRHPTDSFMTMMTVKNMSILIMKDWPDETSYTEYIIPNTYVDQVVSALDKGEIPDELFQELDTEFVNETRQFMLEDLASSLDGILIIKTAKALGDLDFNGTDYQTAMRLYLLALQLVKIVESNKDNITHEKRGFLSSVWSLIKEVASELFCTELDNDGYCPRGQRPDQSPESECSGLCGNGCCCWHWVCGDCCIHKFCLEHDICCAKHGYISIECSAVILDLPSIPCSQGYMYKC